MKAYLAGSYNTPSEPQRYEVVYTAGGLDPLLKECKDQLYKSRMEKREKRTREYEESFLGKLELAERRDQEALNVRNQVFARAQARKEERARERMLAEQDRLTRSMVANNANAGRRRSTSQIVAEKKVNLHTWEVDQRLLDEQAAAASANGDLYDAVGQAALDAARSVSSALSGAAALAGQTAQSRAQDVLRSIDGAASGDAMRDIAQQAKYGVSDARYSALELMSRAKTNVMVRLDESRERVEDKIRDVREERKRNAERNLNARRIAVLDSISMYLE